MPETTMILKCLSIRQPWAGFVMTGKKPVENRTYEAWYHSGIVLIHAGKSWDYRAPVKAFELAVVPHLYRKRREPATVDPRFALGSIVGIAYMGMPHLGDDKPPTPWHDEYYWWWPLRHAAPLREPIPAPGRLYFWDFEIDRKAEIDHPQFTTIENYCQAVWKGELK